jgi:N-acetyl-gamma-glutamyl-phosphate reductase
MKQEEFKVGIVGASSLLGGSLIRILLHHPAVNLIYISSEHRTNEAIAPFFKILNEKLGDKRFDKYSPDYIKKNLDLVFITKPFSESMKCIQKLYNGRLKIIDLSGDFNVKNKKIYENWHHFKHIMPELLKTSVYGLTEFYREEIKRATLVANPGCYATGIILSLFPVIKENLIDTDSIFVNSYAGISGIGRKSVPGTNLFLDAYSNIIAYKISDHPHVPEMEEQLSLIHKKRVTINFIPHITSINSGIFNTIFSKLKKRVTNNEVIQVYHKIYSTCGFIRIFRDEPPQLRGVKNTNYCLIFPKINERTGVLNVLSVLDDRIKGGAGQAVQNMNLMLGFPEKTGLDLP